jgi:hypothetical protein
MKLYKVLMHIDGKLFSPFQSYEYEPGREYICADFDPSLEKSCSHGYYATDIDGIIYSFYDLPECEVWECEVGGRRVEIDQFKRRYERIKLVRQVPLEEVRALAKAEEEKVGYKLSEALFPVNPLIDIKAGPVTDEEIILLREWANVCDSIENSIENSVCHSVYNSIWINTLDKVGGSLWYGGWCRVWGYILDSGYICKNNIEESIWAYISSFYPGIKKWKYIAHPEGKNPFQPCIDLWHRGFVPSFDGKIWRLYAGEKAKIIWKGEIESYDGQSKRKTDYLFYAVDPGYPKPKAKHLDAGTD